MMKHFRRNEHRGDQRQGQPARSDGQMFRHQVEQDASRETSQQSGPPRLGIDCSSVFMAPPMQAVDHVSPIRQDLSASTSIEIETSSPTAAVPSTILLQFKPYS